MIRHGETEWNLTGRWQGHADSPLSDRGISQAEKLGERIKSEKLISFIQVISVELCILQNWLVNHQE